MHSLKRPGRLLAVGVVLAAVVSAIGYGISERKLARVQTLIAECRTEHTRARTTKASWADAPLVCEPSELRDVGRSSSPLIGVQGQIVETESAAWQWRHTSRYVAAGVATLLGVPFAWYFLLNRLRELSAVFKGTP